MITVIPRKIAATSVNGVAVANDGSITLPVDSTPTSNSTNLVTSGGVKTELDALTTRLAGKQDALTFDTTPTSGSRNPVTSGGIYNAEQSVRNTVAIVATGNTAPQAITSGQYVIWNGALHTATTNIPSGGTLSTSNLQAVPNGGLNSLKADLDTLNSGIASMARFYVKGYSQGTGSHTLTFSGSALRRTTYGFICITGQSAIINPVPFALYGSGSAFGEITNVLVPDNDANITASGLVISIPNIGGGWGNVTLLLLYNEPSLTIEYA